MERLRRPALALLGVGSMMLSGCDDLIPHDMASLLVPKFQRSEIVGFLAGFGTTFAAVPDLVAMFRRRSSPGMNPRMAAIMAVFQILWVYYGLLIASRPVIAWNLIAVLTNSFSVGAYLYFVRKERKEGREPARKSYNFVHRRVNSKLKTGGGTSWLHGSGLRRQAPARSNAIPGGGVRTNHAVPFFASANVPNQAKRIAALLCAIPHCPLLSSDPF